MKPKYIFGREDAQHRPFQHFVHIEQGKKKTRKKNRSSDLVDLRTFRLFRGSSDEFTCPSVPLVLEGT